MKPVSITYDDRSVRRFLLASVFWGAVGMLVGVFIACQLAFHQLNLAPWLSFGRLRPLHTNAVIFAFVGNMLFAGIYYSTQRLCKARMASDLLSSIHFWGWQLIIVAAAITLPLGIPQRLVTPLQPGQFLGLQSGRPHGQQRRPEDGQPDPQRDHVVARMRIDRIGHVGSALLHGVDLVEQAGAIPRGKGRRVYRCGADLGGALGAAGQCAGGQQRHQYNQRERASAAALHLHCIAICHATTLAMHNGDCAPGQSPRAPGHEPSRGRSPSSSNCSSRVGADLPSS